MTVNDTYRQLSVLLEPLYERREANGIAALVVEYLTGYRNTDRIVHRADVLNAIQQKAFHLITLQLLENRPVQYVLGEAYFCGMKLYVDEHVLIPRPETEELVEWVVSDLKSTTSYAAVLDIGTGSGCIPVAIKKKLPNIDVYALDVSRQALQVARKNAASQETDIRFFEMNILEINQWQTLPRFDYIVSNPPYIARSEAAAMNNNVLKHEPHLALFVSDENPLQFYDAISSFGIQHLNKGGKLYVEINEAYGKEVTTLLAEKKFKNIELRKDMQGKDRMIKAEAPSAPNP